MSNPQPTPIPFFPNSNSAMHHQNPVAASISSTPIQDLKFNSRSTNPMKSLQNLQKSAQNPTIFTIFQLVFRNDISGLKNFLSNHCKSQKELKFILLKRMPSSLAQSKLASFKEDASKDSRSSSTDLAISSLDLDLPSVALLPLISPGHTLLLQVGLSSTLELSINRIYTRLFRSEILKW